jgi:hypothetical protein
MSTHTATVVNGELKLDVPLALPDISRVMITVESVAASLDSAQRTVEVPGYLRRGSTLHAGRSCKEMMPRVPSRGLRSKHPLPNQTTG